MDGARIWNAAAATGEDVSAWTGAGRHDDVLPVQGPRGADRLGALRPGRADPRGAADLDPVRRRLAAGGHHGRRRARRPGDRTRATRSRTTCARGASRRRSRSCCPAASTSDRVVTNMVFVDTEAVGLRTGEVLDRLAAAGVGAVPVPQGRPHGDPRRRGRRGHRRRDRRLASDRRRRCEGGFVSLFQKSYPPEIADRVPPGQRLVKTWPVLHYGPDPVVRRGELGPRGLRARRGARSRCPTSSSARCRPRRSTPTCTA